MHSVSLALLLPLRQARAQKGCSMLQGLCSVITRNYKTHLGDLCDPRVGPS
jgi:hypothetical protein